MAVLVLTRRRVLEEDHSYCVASCYPVVSRALVETERQALDDTRFLVHMATDLDRRHDRAFWHAATVAVVAVVAYVVEVVAACAFAGIVDHHSRILLDLPDRPSTTVDDHRSSYLGVQRDLERLADDHYHS